MRTLFLILSLVGSLWAYNNWPAGTQRIVPITVNKLKVGEAVSSFTYNFTLILTNETAFKASFNDASDITIFDSTAGLQRSSWIFYVSSTKDTVKGHFNGPTSTSVDKSFFACAGLAIDRINSASAFVDYTNYWGFNEASGSTTADYAGGETGTVTSNTTIGNVGLFGSAAVLPGTNPGRISFTNELIGTGNRTISFLIKRNTSALSYQFLMCNEGFELYIETANGNLYIHNSNATFKSVSAAIPIGAWTMITVTRKSSGLAQAYINGAAVGTESTAGPVGVGSMGLYIGQRNTAYSLSASVDAAFLTSTILTPGIISTIYEQSINPTTFWTQGAGFPSVTDPPTISQGSDSLIFVVSSVGDTGKQWQLNSVDIEGVTDSVYRFSVDSADYASKDVYRGVVSNAGGDSWVEWGLGLGGGVNRVRNNLSTGTNLKIGGF